MWTTVHNHWATPDTYMRALAEGLSINAERFASTLNCSAHLTKCFSKKMRMPLLEQT